MVNGVRCYLCGLAADYETEVGEAVQAVCEEHWRQAHPDLCVGCQDQQPIPGMVWCRQCLEEQGVTD